MDKATISLNFMYSMERFATAVYRSQRGSFKEAFISEKMNYAVDNEWQHASALKDRIIELRRRPTALSAVFKLAGSTLGSVSRLTGKRLALKIDVLIEKRAVKDYGYFVKTLEFDEKTKQLISKIIADEEEHIGNWRESIELLKAKQPENVLEKTPAPK